MLSAAKPPTSPFMTTSQTNPCTSKSFESFLAAAIVKAQAAADACVALHCFGEASSCQGPTPAELREMEEACDRWLAKRERRQERAA
jgi:hypothetical protein